MTDETEVQGIENQTTPPGEVVMPESAAKIEEGPVPSEDHDEEVAELQAAIDKAETPEEKAKQEKKLNAFAKMRRELKEAKESALEAIKDAHYQRGLAEARKAEAKSKEEKPPEPVYTVPAFTEPKPTAPREYEFEETEKYERARTQYEQDKDEWLVKKAKHEAYHEAKADIAQVQADQEHQREAAAYGQWKDKGTEKYPDFLEVVRPDEIQLTIPMREAIRNSEMSHEIAYYLGGNPKEYQRILNTNNPYLQAAAIGKIEDRLKNKPQPKTVSAAPNPIKPVTPTGPTEISDDKLGDKEWLEKERKRCAEKGRLY